MGLAFCGEQYGMTVTVFAGRDRLVPIKANDLGISPVRVAPGERQPLRSQYSKCPCTSTRSRFSGSTSTGREKPLTRRGNTISGIFETLVTSHGWRPAISTLRSNPVFPSDKVRNAIKVPRSGSARARKRTSFL